MSVYSNESPEHLRACFKSLASQTLLANELILIEDGPISSELTEVINFFRQDLGIISFRLPTNVGLACALNIGLKHCSHELVARMDADDIALPERFEKQIAEFKEKPYLDVLGSYAQELDGKEYLGPIRQMPITHQSILDNLYCCPFIHPSIMYKKELILSVGGYNERFQRRQDYDLWFKCALYGANFGNIPEILLIYRFSHKTHSRQSKKDLWLQSLTGFKGVKAMNQPIWKGVFAFLPFIRSLFPRKVEHFLYRVLKRFDPRNR